MTMKQKQRMILSELRKNSRQHITQIAANLGMDKSTCSDNFKAIKPYILQHTTLIDFAKLGYSFRMNFILKNERKALNLLMKSRHINSIQETKNNKLFVWGVFKSMEQAYSLKEELENLGVKNIQLSDVIEEIKKESCF